LERSSFIAVKREADRAIAPVGIAMLVIGAIVAALAFVGVVWVWASTLPDWAYDGIALLVSPLVALTLVLVYLGGRRRIRRRVVRSYEGDSGYGVLAEAVQRGALLRYNVAMAVLAIALFVASQFALAYLSSRLNADEGDDDWNEDAQPSATEALLTPAVPSPPARSSARAPA
jgi:hypothetical protein